MLLGVALVAGTYVLTDTINQSFDDIFHESLKGTDVTVSPRTDVQTDNGPPPAFPASLLGKVNAVPGVAAAEGSLFSQGRFVKANGDPIGAKFAPNFISSALSKRFETLTYTEGRQPRTPDEASIDQQTADRGHLKLGGRLRIAGEQHVKAYRIVGIARLGKTSFGGAAVAQVTLAEARRITNKEGKFDQISIAAAKNVQPRVLRDRIRRVMPRSVIVETAGQAADRQTKDIEDNLSFIKIALLVFAFVSLFVGAFQIFNTFSITVAQRVREFGLLRTLGASRRQVLRAVVLEALLIGVAGSALGFLAGIGVSSGLNSLFKAIGVDLPNTGTVIQARTPIVAFALGVGITLVAALSPALRATRVSPMAALREAELPESRGRGRVFAAVAALLVLGGVVLTCVGLFGGIEDSGAAAGLMGGGAVATLLGVSMFSPRLVKPLASVAGWPLERIRGLAGRLARENALRKPARTAVTAAALMIGLGLVAFVTIFAAGISDSIAKAVDKSFAGDLTLQNIDGFSSIPAKAGEEAARVPGVQTVSSFSTTAGHVRKPRKEKLNVSGIEPRTVRQVFKFSWKHGSEATLDSLGPHDAIADDAWAKDRGVKVGDTLRVQTPTERFVPLRIVATVKNDTGLYFDIVAPASTLRRDFGTEAPTQTLIKLAPGANAKAVKKQLTADFKRRFPTIDVLNQKELKDAQQGQIKSLLGLVYGLLSLAVIVSIFGIVNTLALSIHERTRELGLLRAVGMSRRQVRRVIRYEAVITALIGAILGTILGLLFAILISRPLADEGFSLSIPVPTLIALLVVAAVLGVIAAIGPARRAAKLDVLEALAYE